LVATVRVVFLAERAAEERCRAEHSKKVHGRICAIHALGLTASTEREVTPRVHRHRSHGAQPLTVVCVQPVGIVDDRQSFVGSSPPERHELVRIRVRKRTQKQRVDEAEDRRVDTETDGECEQRNCCEAWALEQCSDCVASIGTQSAERPAP